MTEPTEQPEPGREPDALTSMHVRRALDGNHASLAWVVRRLSPLLLAQADYRLGPQLRAIYDAEDLVNETWLVVLPKLPDLIARDGRYTPVLLRFLSTTLLYRLQNLARKHARQGLGERTPSGDDPLEGLGDDHSGVITRAVRDEQRDVVRRTIDALDPKDREVLLMRGVEQQENRTVAMLLGISAKAVTMRYARALARLRAQLPGSVFDDLA